MHLPVTLELRRSRLLAAALVAIHGAAALGIVSVGTSTMSAAVIAIAVVSSLIYALWRHVVRPPVSTLTLKSDGSLDLGLSDGSHECAKVLPQTAVFPWLVTMMVCAGSRRLAFALPPDALTADGHRQLRLWLRWKASAAAA